MDSGDELSGYGVDDEVSYGSSGEKRKRPYFRHSPDQIQVLETQIKFWFQNRRTQFKTQQEKVENETLKEESERLGTENRMLREAVANPYCSNCLGIALTPEEQSRQQFYHTMLRQNLILHNDYQRLRDMMALRRAPGFGF
ncbi:OLC1v1018503C1 [Oldenlandia corymbosa var. corymbosa]|uniref:OLC1v1018503C1 n=1 Tax=Oldenlandia corymbosa var. corymbosa TaxID=529605 RepID=A0AAV1EBU9_OLDCO|nr:OLC1v1018503C1 [Oldenlandia corymbosa var. corymbosa]